ncbi:MAG: RagB/SusD family nutrient uptake outer membrane protein [Alistipes sp.]|nr:RagB/SusD family nutrient uptake outer membrane protein [Alistipes sp.]MBQ8367421.1 RagB/SusD family nutrient uptake outer membrane protein [Alistipes sp.]
MKVNKIFKTAALVLCSAVLFSGCIKEVLPKAGSITQEQLADSDAGLGYMMKAIPAYMAASTAMSYDHSDFGYHSIGVWMDHHALIAFPCTRPDRGGNPYYCRFQATNYGFDMSMNGGYTHYLWYNYYPLIKKANEVIGAAGDQEDMIEYRAISKAFRALFYLDLARYYDPLPAKAPELPTYEGDLEKVKGYTVPIVTETTDEEAAKNNPRATREELFEFILADLADAEAIMKRFENDPTTGKPELEAEVYGTTPTYPDLAVVYGLYARTYLWLGGFDDVTYENVPTGNDAYRLAAEYARKAIDTSMAPIMTENEWTNVTTGFNTIIPSWMWATTLSSDTVLNNLFAFVAHMCPEATYGYAPLACQGVSSGMYDKLNSSDFRKKLIVGPNTTYEEFQPYTSMSRAEWEELAYRAPYTNFKFRPAMGERVDYMTANAVALPIMRVEEMYFIEMEAMAHYDDAQAKNLLGQFMQGNRDSRYGRHVMANVDIVEEIIFQKSVEFWGEGLVLFDMKRLNMGVNTLDQNYQSGMLFKTEGRLPWWNIPIPSSESSVNTAIKGFEGPDPSYGYESQDAI